jgi:hypothetical protein
MTDRPTGVQDDFVKTYFALRVALGVLALGLPLALWSGGHLLQGLALQPSISAYYHSDVRDVFVGMLWAIGAGLVAYKGFSRREDLALNVGGVLACCIAVFPMNPADALGCILPDCPGGTCASIAAPFSRTAQVLIDAKLHFPSAISFYVVLGFVMIFCSHQTLHLVPVRERRWYLAAYPALGTAFVTSMVAVFLILKVFTQNNPCLDHRVLGVEVAGIVPFSIYWFVKTIECARHDTDRRIPNRRRPHEMLPKPGEVPRPPTARDKAAQPKATAPASTWEEYKALWRDEPIGSP